MGSVFLSDAANAMHMRGRSVVNNAYIHADLLLCGGTVVISDVSRIFAKSVVDPQFHTQI